MFRCTNSIQTIMIQAVTYTLEMFENVIVNTFKNQNIIKLETDSEMPAPCCVYFLTFNMCYIF